MARQKYRHSYHEAQRTPPSPLDAPSDASIPDAHEVETAAPPVPEAPCVGTPTPERYIGAAETPAVRACVGGTVLFQASERAWPALVVAVYPDGVIDLVYFHTPTWGNGGSTCSTFAGQVHPGVSDRTWRNR